MEVEKKKENRKGKAREGKGKEGEEKGNWLGVGGGGS